MARPNGSRKIRGWVMTPTEMARAGLIDPADLERAEQGEGEHAVMVTRLKPSAVKRLDEELERLKQDARSGDDEFFLVDTEGAKEALASLVEAKRATNAPRSEIERKVFAEEKRIRNNGYETGVVVTTDGRVIKQKGGRTQVNLNAEQIEAMPGSVFTHNHPGGVSDPVKRAIFSVRKIGGFSLSPGDIGSLSYYKNAEVRAVTPKLEFSVKNKNWKQEYDQVRNSSAQSRSNDYNRFMSSYNTTGEVTKRRLNSLVRQNKMTQGEAAAVFCHLTARDFCARSWGQGKNYEYSVTGDRAALAELARIEKIYDEG